MKYFLLLGMLICPYFFSLTSQAQTGYRIEGNLEGLPDGILQLKRYFDGQVLAETESKNGTFVFEQSGPVVGEKTFLEFGGKSLRNPPIYLESGNICIGGTLDQFIVRGSISNDAYHDYLAYIAPVQRTIDSLNRLAGAEQDPALKRALLSEVNNQYQKQFYPMRKQFAYTHNNSILAPEMLSAGIGELDYAAFKAMVDRLDPNMQPNFYMNRLLQRLEILERTDIGRILPNFTLPDTSGNHFSFDELKGQCVLIDFWASWCAPCRAENGNLKKLYAKYREQGFNIVAVSIDDKADRWKAAIEEDQVPWIHVSSLSGWTCPMANAYGVAYGMTGVPYSLLIGKDGCVVGYNLRGEKLAKKLEEVMGF